MQRFLCCRGNYSYRKGNKAKDSAAPKEVEEGAAGEGEGEGKVGAHKKRGRKPGKKSTPVIKVKNSVEKGVATAGTGNGQAVPSTENLGRGGDKKDAVEKDVESVVELEEEHVEVEDAAQDGAHDLGDGDGANSDAHEGEMEKEVEVKEKRGRGRPRKAVTEDNALQACVSTDLGVMASQCAVDERKKILNKYLSKRQSRPASGRPAKPSERRSKRLEKQNLKNEKKGLPIASHCCIYIKMPPRNNHLFIFSNLIYNNHPFMAVLKCTRNSNRTLFYYNVEINLRIQAAVNISAAQSGMKSNVARAPAHKYDKTDAIHSSHSPHMCRVDCLLSNL
ncbi:hypothetical protein TRIUR3_15744 [Triticum urartu]|uniref:Uncharacterized protein n=1 Tax=Triticum urartu TaxID=4572 RepID=M7ZRS0_TRIUA|nr:hypothetical protein TRIUR3_15744 [Triticum urartu]